MISAIEIYEVYKKLRREYPEDRVIEGIASLHRVASIAVDETIALLAADLSLEYGLAMTDSLIYATARQLDVILVSKDPDFKELPHTIVLE